MNDLMINQEVKIPPVLIAFKDELGHELDNILHYWLNNMQDEAYGGFLGKRLWNEEPVDDAPKSIVLNARILWTFSAAYKQTQNKQYLQAANRAYDYITRFFIDHVYGGVYWSVTYDGKPLDTKKQIYAQSFAVYALAEYYQCCKKEKSKEQAILLFHLIEEHSRDKKLGGYIEAFTRQWKPIDDLRLSEKDANEKKTMNTHLHILEAYTNLYKIYPHSDVRNGILHLLEVFDSYIIDAGNHHLILFFDEHWNRKGTQVSYGHDIEAAWLLCEAAEVIDDAYWLKKMRMHALNIVDAAREGLDADNGLWHEYDPATNHLLKEKHWWPQAEAMVGFMHAWQITGQEKYLHYMQNSWEFIDKYLLDKVNGEWIWGVKEDYSLIDTEDKVGFWKGPYHNGRACLEIIDRVNEISGLNDNRLK